MPVSRIDQAGRSPTWRGRLIQGEDAVPALRSMITTEVSASWSRDPHQEPEHLQEDPRGRIRRSRKHGRLFRMHQEKRSGSCPGGGVPG